LSAAGDAEEIEGLWLVEAPDILDLVAPERAKLAGTLAAWLDALRLPAKLLVCSRQDLEAPVSTGPGGAGFAAELQSELEAAFGPGSDGRQVFRRQVFLAVSSGDGRKERRSGGGPPMMATASVRPMTRPPGLAEGPWRELPSALLAGGRWMVSLWLERLPGVEVEPGWLWALVGLRGEFDLLLEIWPRSHGEADRSLRRRMRGLRARQLVAGDRGDVEDPGVAAAMESTSQLRRVLATSQGGLFDVAVTVTVAASTAQGAGELAAQLGSRTAALRGLLVPAWCDQAPARMRTGLRSSRGHSRKRVVHTAELASCWPWLDAWNGQVSGAARIGSHLRTGAPVWLALFDEGSLPNANLGVVAASGSGKSYLGGLLGLEAVRLGVQTVVIDPENEHRRWCEAAGGQYLEIGEPLATSFNLLEMAEPATAPSAVAELLSLLWGHLSPAEIGCVAEAVRGTLDEAGGRPMVISDCLPRLRRTEVGESLATRLLPWVEGPAGALFNRPGRGPTVGTVAAIGLRELPAAWVPAATLLISHWLWSWIRFQPGPKQAIVDEAGLLSDNAPLQRLMAHLARRIRKYRGSLVLLTQSAGDLLGSAAGEVMAVNSATMLLGNQHPAAAQRLQRAFLLDEAQRSWLEGASRGEFLLLMGSRRSSVQIEAPPLYHRLLAAERPD
jgi:hypothetical protein